MGVFAVDPAPSVDDRFFSGINGSRRIPFSCPFFISQAGIRVSDWPNGHENGYTGAWVHSGTALRTGRSTGWIVTAAVRKMVSGIGAVCIGTILLQSDSGLSTGWRKSSSLPFAYADSGTCRWNLQGSGNSGIYWISGSQFLGEMESVCHFAGLYSDCEGRIRKNTLQTNVSQGTIVLPLTKR